MAASGGSGALSNGSGAEVPDVCRLHVGALNVGLTRQDLHDVFSPFGAIDAIELVMPEGKPLGFAFIQFRSAESAAMAMRHMNGFMLAGHALKIGFATPRHSRR